MQKTFNRRKTYFWCTAPQLIVEVQTQYTKDRLTCISCYKNYILDIIEMKHVGKDSYVQVFFKTQFTMKHYF